MGKYSGTLICSDLDGTLCNSNGVISEKNLRAIEYFCDNGGLFTLCTGRSPSYAKNLIAEGLKINTLLIALNGAMIYDLQNEEVYYENPMNKERLNGIDDFIENNRHLITDVVYHSESNAETFSDIGDDKLYKIVFVSNNSEDSKELRKRLSEKYSYGFFITNSWAEGLEILDINSTKGNCIKLIRNCFKDKINKIICAGDYENDVSMLLEADISYAVSNAVPEAKKSASEITVSNNEDALAEIIYNL